MKPKALRLTQASTNWRLELELEGPLWDEGTPHSHLTPVALSLLQLSPLFYLLPKTSQRT